MEEDYRHKSMHVHCFPIYLNPNMTLYAAKRKSDSGSCFL